MSHWDLCNVRKGDKLRFKPLEELKQFEEVCYCTDCESRAGQEVIVRRADDMGKKFHYRFNIQIEGSEFCYPSYLFTGV